MQDSYQAFIYAKVICPKCGFLMDRATTQLVVCPNYKSCDLAGVVFEAPSVELKRFIPSKEPDRLPESIELTSAPN
jgi:hypothetical protein